MKHENENIFINFFRQHFNNRKFNLLHSRGEGDREGVPSPKKGCWKMREWSKVRKKVRNNIVGEMCLH